MQSSDMVLTARALVAPGKGILAADESLPTIEKRFKSVGVTSSVETRRAYREALFTAFGLGEYISGVILFDETIRQKAANGTPLAEVLASQAIIPGIKVDQGVKPLAGFAGEIVTEGLDGLRERLDAYSRMGARFTKWRAVFTVGPQAPLPAGLESNTHALARFAALSQEAGLVPVVEPEVLMDGNHTMARHAEVTEEVLRRTFQDLATQRVRLEAILLKTNMVLPGKECLQTATVDEVAAATLHVLLRTVPAAVPGIVFLSGGQDDVRATQHLNALNILDHAPWQLSFSYGRALQGPALRCWAGQSDKVEEMQQALLHRAQCNSEARFGRYLGEGGRLAGTKEGSISWN